MMNETIHKTTQNQTVENDLARAITVDEILAKVREGLTEMFRRKEAGKAQEE